MHNLATIFLPSGSSLIEILMQIVAVIILLFLTEKLHKKELARHGKLFGFYPKNLRTLIAPIYEEVIFRGFLLMPLAVSFSWSANSNHLGVAVYGSNNL